MLVKAPEPTSLKLNRGKVILLFVLIGSIGLPAWLLTTAVYRAALPHREIESMKHSEFGLKYDVYVVGFEDSWADKLDKLLRPAESVLSTQLNELRVQYAISVTGKPRLISDLPETAIVVQASPEKSTNVFPNRTISVPKDSEPKTIATLLMRFLTEEAKILFSRWNEDNQVVVPYKSKLLLSFSLMNGNTENALIDWDIEGATMKYLMPFLKKLSIVSEFQVSSQIQQYATIKVNPQKTGLFYEVKSNDLPHFINSGDWNLASSTSTDAELNFVLYIPHESVSPLNITENGIASELNAFLSPRSGGLVIYNNAKSRLSVEDLKFPMEVFVKQLRDLLGIKDAWDGANNAKVFKSSLGVSDWEICTHLRKRTLENISNGIDTLSSLSRMLQKLQNVVVNDHIAKLVSDALQSFSCSFQSLDELALFKPFAYARDALELSEKAFFDPTMTSMLYFPDEHLYAVYAPLFFPIAVPVIISIFKYFKRDKS